LSEPEITRGIVLFGSGSRDTTEAVWATMETPVDFSNEVHQRR
jgi:hypothetical protein